jgi:hypothetical protein
VLVTSPPGFFTRDYFQRRADGAGGFRGGSALRRSCKLTPFLSAAATLRSADRAATMFRFGLDTRPLRTLDITGSQLDLVATVVRLAAASDLLPKISH